MPSIVSRLQLLAVLIVAWLPLPSAIAQPGEAAPRPHLALVSTERSPEVENILTLTEAHLSANDTVDLLDRRTLDRALAEQRLSLSGFVNDDQAIKAGKLLGVNLLAVLETDIANKQVLGLVVFDAVTSVRVWDAPLPDRRLDKAVDNLSRAIGAAVDKHSKLDKEVKTVCVAAVRNVDLPRDKASFCDTVGYLLERGLANSPSLALLERRRLAQVLEERNLPTDSPLRRLLTSVLRVELQFQRGPGKNDIQATAFLYDGAGKKLVEKQVNGPGDSPAKLADLLLPELARMLQVNPVQKAVEPELEAARFAREADYLYFHREWVKELAARDAAIALNPTDYNQRRKRILCLSLMGSTTHTSNAIPQRSPLTAERLRNALERNILRAEEIERVEAAWQADPSVLEIEVHFPLSNYTSDKAALVKVHTPQTLQLLEELHTINARIYKARLDHTRQGVVNQTSFEKALLSMKRNQFLREGESYHLQPPRFQQLWREHARTLFKLGERHGNPPPSQAAISNLYELFRIIELEKIDVPEMGHYRKVLRESGNPLILVHEKLLAFILENKQTTERQRHERTREFRVFLQQMIETHGGNLPELRTTCYEAFNQLRFHSPGFNSAMLTHPVGKECSEFVTFMIAQNDYYPLLAGAVHTNLSRSRTREDEVIALALIEAMTRLLDSSQCRFLIVDTSRGSEAIQMKFERQRLAARKQQILSHHPDLAGDRVNPWVEIRPFIDVIGAQRGTMRLARPIVHDGSVYAVALGQESSNPASRYVQLLRFSLSDGKLTHLGKVAMETGYQPPTDGQRIRSAGYPNFGEHNAIHRFPFVIDGCIDDGKYILGTRDKGVVIFPLNGGRVERLHTGNHLPSNTVQCLTSLEGKLLVALGGEGGEGCFLLTHELRTETTTLIASSRRAEAQSPFDDSPSFQVHQMVVDADRKQAILLTRTPSKPDSEGIWAFDGITLKLKQLYSEPAGLMGWMSPVWEGRVLCAIYRQTVLLDLKTGKNESLPYNRVNSSSGLLGLDPRLADVLAVTKPGQPPRELLRGHFFHGGWLYAYSTFTRTSLDGKTTQPLASPRKDSTFPFHPHECFQLIGDNQVLIGDAHGLWLAKFK